MLELAYHNREELKSKFIDIAFNEKYKYWDSSTYIDYEPEVAKSSYEKIQYVSKQNGKIIGYLSASVNVVCGYISNLSVVNFYDKNIEFSKDFYKFLTDLFIKFKFYKVGFLVVIGNPAERMYDRFIKKYDGRVIGTFVKDTKLWTGEYCDTKCYEIFRENFMKNYKGDKLN